MMEPVTARTSSSRTWQIFFVLTAACVRLPLVQPDTCSSRTEYHRLHHPFNATFNVCNCEHCPESLHITSAWVTNPLMDTAQVDEKLSFWYPFEGNRLPSLPGTHEYSFEYSYSCGTGLGCFEFGCECESTLSLTVKIASFHLFASQKHARGGVTLTCNSGLQDSSEVQVRFNFTSSSGETREEVCGEGVSDKDGWVWYRNATPPHDCVLKVVNYKAGYAGTYQCYGVLSGSEYDVSNVHKIAFQEDNSEGNSALTPTIAAIVGLSVGIVFILLVVVYCKCRGRGRGPYQQMNTQGRSRYNSTGEVPGMDPPERYHDAPYDPNLTCPTCGERFRIGQIQLLRQHAQTCNA